MSDCGVCIGGWEGDAADFYHEEFPKARKRHVCHECRRSIEFGQTYNRVTGSWDGEIGRYKFCSDCCDIAKSLSCDGSRTFGNLWDDVEKYVFPEMTTGCLSRLETASAKAYLLKRWQQWKGLK